MGGGEDNRRRERSERERSRDEVGNCRACIRPLVDMWWVQWRLCMVEVESEWREGRVVWRGGGMPGRSPAQIEEGDEESEEESEDSKSRD